MKESLVYIMLTAELSGLGRSIVWTHLTSSGGDVAINCMFETVRWINCIKHGMKQGRSNNNATPHNI